MSPALSAMAALPLLGWSVHAAALRHRLDLARRDPLTGLATRGQFTDRATRLLRASPALVVLVDLDRFKPINDTHGHAAGDAVLRAVAERLTAWIGRSGIAARLGGDEFAAILPAPADPGQELTDLHYSLTRPVAYQAKQLEIGASIGAHLAPASEPLSAALCAADVTMYTAKRHSGGWHLASPDGPAESEAPGRWRRHRPQPSADAPNAPLPKP